MTNELRNRNKMCVRVCVWWKVNSAENMGNEKNVAVLQMENLILYRLVFKYFNLFIQ